MKLIYPTECSNEVLIPLKISGISIIYPKGLDKNDFQHYFSLVGNPSSFILFFCAWYTLFHTKEP
jgi:hypothetical protein